jgi:hypothetical protein
MATMCNDCFEIDKRKYKYGRWCKHCGGELVQIDELWLPIVSLLNQKGYYTSFCCSGHASDDFSSPYISFIGSCELPNLPKGFELEKYDDSPYFQFCIRHPYIENKSEFDAHIEILNATVNLLDWVRNLPTVKNKLPHESVLSCGTTN